MPARRAKKKKKCGICGKANPGPADICPSCSGAGSARRRVAERVRDRVAGGETGGFICPYCKAELSWETLGTSETEVTIYVREKIYFCGRCRSFLGVSSWHTEG